MGVPLDRRKFLGMLAAGSGRTAAWGLEGRSRSLGQAAAGGRLPKPVERIPLPPVSSVSADRLTLTARRGALNLGLGRTPALTLNDTVPSPLLRIRRGETAKIQLQNRLQEETILHWHGLTVPQEADGHPRLAIGPGSAYSYQFTVRDRAGTYWYHPHTHGLTGPQTYEGMAGLLIVEDEEERALELPSGEFELPLLLQDKRLAGSNVVEYNAFGPDFMVGFLGDTPVVNGVAHPGVEVKRARYRLRLLNGSNARIFNLGLSDGAPFTLIGSDGGLLEEPAPLERLFLATGERADLLVDFSRYPPGRRVMLRSFEFEVPGMMMGMGPRGRGMGRGRGPMGMMGAGQGREMDLLEFSVQASSPDPGSPLPARLSEISRRTVSSDTPRRSFRFESRMRNHTINGRSFSLTRVDERIPLGRTEIWTFLNDSPLPHPIHIHLGQFQILSRSGGRNRVMPWEQGLKDTFLTFPGERIEIIVGFDDYRGLFLLHCHNLEHEDMGMMLNFEVV